MSKITLKKAIDELDFLSNSYKLTDNMALLQKNQIKLNVISTPQDILQLVNIEAPIKLKKQISYLYPKDLYGRHRLNTGKDRREVSISTSEVFSHMGELICDKYDQCELSDKEWDKVWKSDEARAAMDEISLNYAADKLVDIFNLD